MKTYLIRAINFSGSIGGSYTFSSTRLLSGFEYAVETYKKPWKQILMIKLNVISWPRRPTDGTDGCTIELTGKCNRITQIYSLPRKKRQEFPSLSSFEEDLGNYDERGLVCHEYLWIFQTPCQLYGITSSNDICCNSFPENRKFIKLMCNMLGFCYFLLKIQYISCHRLYNK